MAACASFIVGCTPAATAANIAAPKAQACSDLATLIGIPNTSASVCITRGDFNEIPPIPITLSISMPFSRKRSTIAFDPKAVASTNALKMMGALLARFSPVSVPFTN